jgi:hypothetical protein
MPGREDLENDDADSFPAVVFAMRRLAFSLLRARRMTRLSRALIVTTALVATLRSPAYAWTDKTPSLPQAPGGFLYCKVAATSTVPIGIVARIISARGANVTQFGTGLRAETEDGFYAEETAGTYDAGSSRYFCKLTVTGARKRYVEATLTSFDAAGEPIATVEMR